MNKQLGPSSTENPVYDPAKESKDTLVTPLKPYDEEAESQQINALYSFLENRYIKKVGYQMVPNHIVWNTDQL